MKVESVVRNRLAPNIYQWELSFNNPQGKTLEFYITADWGRFISEEYGDPISFGIEEQFFMLDRTLEIIGLDMYADNKVAVSYALMLKDASQDVYKMPISTPSAHYFISVSIGVPITDNGVITYTLP